MWSATAKMVQKVKDNQIKISGRLFLQHLSLCRPLSLSLGTLIGHFFSLLLAFGSFFFTELSLLVSFLFQLLHLLLSFLLLLFERLEVK